MNIDRALVITGWITIAAAVIGVVASLLVAPITDYSSSDTYAPYYLMSNELRELVDLGNAWELAQ